jgi:hypothetical protein
MDHNNPHDLHQNHSNHPTPPHLVKRGSQIACNHKKCYHDSCTLYKGSVLYPRVVISSLAKQLGNLLFAILTLLWCMAQRSLHAITKVYHRSATVFPYLGSLLAVLRFPRDSSPSCTLWIR